MVDLKHSKAGAISNLADTIKQVNKRIRECAELGLKVEIRVTRTDLNGIPVMFPEIAAGVNDDKR